MRKTTPGFVVCVLGLSMLACATFIGAPVPPTSTARPTKVPTPTSSPEPTLTPTPAALLLGQTVILTSEVISETNPSPHYTITAQLPVLQGRDDPRLIHFNQTVSTLVQQEVTTFKNGALDFPQALEGSYFDVSYMLISPPGDLVSLQFGVTGYIAGAAHPYHYTRTFNYQLSTGQVLTLDELFLPEAHYLDALAAYCKAELNQRLGKVFFEGGADPKPENYQNWNLWLEGLLITFDEYQVAPYAAGLQTVVIPYSTLANILDPQGPVAALEAP